MDEELNWNKNTLITILGQSIGIIVLIQCISGNIMTYFRNGTTAGGNPLAMDSLSYKYQNGNNRLDHVNDGVAATNYSVDIDNEDTLNYRYDQIGNLTKDSSGELTLFI